MCVFSDKFFKLVNLYWIKRLIGGVLGNFEADVMVFWKNVMLGSFKWVEDYGKKSIFDK